MKIFRSLLEIKSGKFLVDARHENKKLSLLNIHPVNDGVVWAALPLCHFDNTGILIKAIQEKIEGMG